MMDLGTIGMPFFPKDLRITQYISNIKFIKSTVMKSILYLRNLKLKRITTRLKLNPLYLLFHCIILQSKSEKNALNSIAQLFIHHALNISTLNSLLQGLYSFVFVFQPSRMTSFKTLAFMSL